MPKASKPKQYDDSVVVQKGLPCEMPECGSSNAVALYDDNHRHCFSCGHTYPGDNKRVATAKKVPPKQAEEAGRLEALLATGRIAAIKTRMLTQETARKFGYLLRINPKNSHYEHLAPYYDEHHTLVGVKVRDLGEDGEGKDFYWVGSSGDNLYGRHLWNAGGRILTVIEGEIDTMTMSQANGHQFPVVGIPNGAQNAAKAIAQNLPFVLSFDKVVFGFDMDKQGREANIECAKLLPPGKAFIAKWPEKDPNECLIKGIPTDKLTWAVHSAEAYRPDGIVDARALTATCLEAPTMGLPWPYPFLTKWTYGRKDGTLYTLGSGTGMGKSDLMAEVVAADLQGKNRSGDEWEPQGWAVFSFEAGAAKVKKQIASKIGQKRFHLPPRDDGSGWTQQELLDTMDYMDRDCWNRGGRFFVNDSFGLADWESVVDRARYLVAAEGVKNILVDPIGALVMGSDDERKLLDKITLEASMLAQEGHGCKVYLVSHLTRPSLGASHEEGGHVRLNQFRGSNGVGMYSAYVMGWEGNQQAETDAERKQRTLRMVKDRDSGESTGLTQNLIYNPITGTLDLPYEDDVPQFAGGLDE